MNNTYAATRQAAHPHCRLCGAQEASIPPLVFQLTAAGSVHTTFTCDLGSEGYGGLMHGGLAAAVLDAACTNALFSAGHIAMTVHLDLRYRRPLHLGIPVQAEAVVTGQRVSGWTVTARLVQNQQPCVTATALFLPLPTKNRS